MFRIRTFLDCVEWLGTISGVTAAIIIASNLTFTGSVGFGFCIYLISSISFTYVGYRLKRWGLMAMNVVFICINIWGIYNWLWLI